MSIKSPYSIVFCSFIPLSASYAHEPLLEQIEVTGRRANLIGEARPASKDLVSGDESFLSQGGFNLFDSSDRDIEYFYESQLLNESTPVEDRHFHVFEPRSVRASLTWYY